jgi:hypothetical protein
MPWGVMYGTGLGWVGWVGWVGWFTARAASEAQPDFELGDEKRKCSLRCKLMICICSGNN